MSAFENITNKIAEQNAKIEAMRKAFAKLLEENEDMLKEVYGDHAAVYLTPTEVIVEEYSHD